MGLIWDDKTIERAKKQDKETKWVWLLSLILFAIVSIILLPEFNYIKFGFLTLSGASLIVGIYEYIYKTTHFRIPDDISEEEKSSTRLLFLFLNIATFCICIIWIWKDWI